MKIKVSMKTPDAVYEAVKDTVESMELSSDESKDLIEEQCSKLDKWFKYGEYLCCEFDTDTMTATVLDA